jgi:hypothetical protein
MPSKTLKGETRLPKPVLDRIHRYAAEGRVLQESHGDDGCRLLALANWQFPAVILSSPRDKFAQLRNAAQAEWARAARRHRNTRRSFSTLPELANNYTGRMTGLASNRS